MNDERWIVIHKWSEYQHYKDRDPIFIKDYRSQLADDDYLELSFHLRGILKDLRLAYADACGQLLGSTSALTRRLGGRVTTRDLEALNHAGYIHFSASKPLALAPARERSREKRRVEKNNALAHEHHKPAETRAAADAYQPFQHDAAPERDTDLGLAAIRTILGTNNDRTHH